MPLYFKLCVGLGEAPWTVAEPPAAITVGDVQRELTAREPADQEENAVRLAEQLVREAFARHRKKLAETRGEPRPC